MKNSQTLTLLKRKYTFNILDTLEAEIEVVNNPYQIPIEELFTMAARVNKKRSFLFVSRVLGKHLPINPNIGLLTAALLAARYVETVKGIECVVRQELLTSFLNRESFSDFAFIQKNIQPVVIGFAETATALGHAFFDCFQAAEFFHTTREVLINENPKITFEEEHSHATSHRCYIPSEMIDNEREIILVDDEMTTGKTALNIIQSIHEQFPRREYTVVSILDWRSKENQDKFTQLEDSLGVKINVVSLISGHVQVKQLREMEGRSEIDEPKEFVLPVVEFLDLSSFFTVNSLTSSNQLNQASFIEETGRFGLRSVENVSLHEKVNAAAAFLEQKRAGKKTLCLGTGEFMYLPMKLSSKMGSGVWYQSTTRSPIYIENIEGYGARFGAAFPNPEDPEVSHFVYNIPPNHYDDLFVFFEREASLANLQPLLRELEKFGIKSIKIVFFSNVRGEKYAKSNQ